jgi:hypothetical protein
MDNMKWSKRHVLKASDVKSSLPIASELYFYDEPLPEPVVELSEQPEEPEPEQESEPEPEEIEEPDVKPLVTKEEFQCSRCDFTSRYQASLHRHERQVHRKKLHLHCPLCERTVQSKTSLEQHLSSCFKSKRKCSKVGAEMLDIVVGLLKRRSQRKCKSCFFVADSPLDLFEHRLTAHTAFKQHVCMHCSACFRTAAQCRQHERQCRLQLLLPRNQFVFARWSGCFACLFCSFRSRRKGVVVSHLHKRHPTSMKCSSCQKRFLRIEDAQLHLKLHPGVCSMILQSALFHLFQERIHARRVALCCEQGRSCGSTV